MRLLTIVFCALGFSFAVQSQSLVIPSDSSSITYPDNAKISLTKRLLDDKRTYFVMDRKEFKGMVFITNYMLKRLDISLKSVELLQKNDNLFDSTAKIFDRRVALERNRSDLYKDAYEDLKNVSAFYDQQLLKCAGDLEKLNNQKERAKGKSFIKGVLWGLAIGTVGGFAAGLAN